MTIALCIKLLIILITIYIYEAFNKKYMNTPAYAFIKNCFWICICLLPLICYIFIKDLTHAQMPDNANGSYVLGVALITFVSPILVTLGFLIGHVFFLALFMIVNLIISKAYGNNLKFILSILLTTLAMVIILQIIWWGIFYSEGSIPLRIYTWNIAILTLPWLPIIGAILIQKWKDQKRRQ